MEYKLQTQPNTPERDAEVEAIETLKDTDLDFQIGFYHLTDGLMIFPEWHPTLRKQSRFRELNAPFRTNRYVAIPTVGPLLDNRWSVETAAHRQWVASYTQQVLPYTSLVILAKRAVSELQLEDTTANRNFLLNSLWVRVFTQTEEGFQRELTAKRFIVDTDGSCERVVEEVGGNSHIDFVSPLAGYQVKTPTFLVPTRNSGHRADQGRNLSAQWEWSERMQLPVFYLVVDGTGRVTKIPLPDAVRMCALKAA